MAALGGKEGLEGSEVESRAFESLEREFQAVLHELVGDKSLEKFRVEYEKVYRALKKSHDNEQRLVKKCRELNSEIVANAAKVQTALKLSEEDQQTINALKKEIEKAWKTVDASHEKEAKAKETILQLRADVASLTKVVESGSGLGMADEASLQELIKQRDELTHERDSQVETIMYLRADMADMQARMRQAEDEKLTLESDIQALKDSLASKKAEAERETRKRERLEKEVKEQKGLVDSRNADIKSKQVQIQNAEEQVAKLEQMLKDAKGQTERIQKDYSSLNDRVAKLHHELEEQIHANTQLQADNSAKQTELRAKEEEVRHLQTEGIKLGKLKDVTAKKLRQEEEKKGALEVEREEMRSQMAHLEKELEASRRAVEMESKKLAELHRERDLLTKLRTQAENQTHKSEDLLKVNENTKRNLEQEIGSYQLEVQKQQKLIHQLEKERGKYAEEAAEATAKVLKGMEELKLREMAVVELQKRIGDGEAKLKQQQNLYEAVRSDRNLYSKNLIEAQDEIQEMKRKFKIMQHQIEQLKEEIGAKDLALVKEHFDHMKVEKEKDALRGEVDKSQLKIAEAEKAISTQATEIAKLNHIIQEADQERLRQKKEYDIVVNERDILGTQLIRRNDELALLYEKIKIMQSTLSRGQVQYRDRVNEIRVLKIKLNDLRRELHILKTSVANVDVLKREVHQLGRELLQERTKVKALSEELENPLNVHRWRKLEGSDPSTFEMIQKIQTLQKRLIAKTEESVEKDLLIQEKEKLYIELKNILARQPGPEVGEQLHIYQANLRDKTKQLKAMASELNMYQAQTNEYKYEIERLVRELNDMKKKYFETKRKEQLQQEKGMKPILPPAPASSPGVARFTGGGFSLNQGPAVGST